MSKQSPQSAPLLLVVVIAAFFIVSLLAFNARQKPTPPTPTPVIVHPTPIIDAKPEPKPIPPVLPQPNVQSMTDAALMAVLRERSGKPSDAETRLILQEAIRRGLLKEDSEPEGRRKIGRRR